METLNLFFGFIGYFILVPLNLGVLSWIFGFFWRFSSRSFSLFFLLIKSERIYPGKVIPKVGKTFLAKIKLLAWIFREQGIELAFKQDDEFKKTKYWFWSPEKHYVA
jgi:hypothetical protein